MKKWIAATALSLVVAVSAICGQQGGMARQIEKKETGLTSDFNPTKHAVVDLRQQLKEMRFKEGSNLVYTFGTGVSLSAKVKNGEIVSYLATDSQGNIVPVMVFENRVRADHRKQALSKLEQAAKKHEEREEAMREAMEKAMEGAIAKGCVVCVLTSEGAACGYVDCPKG